MINKNNSTNRQNQQAKIQKLNNYINPNQSFASILNRHNNPNTKTQLRTTQETLNPSQCQNHTQRNETIATNIHIPPPWVNELKNEFKAMASRLYALEASIAQNASRIDQLFGIIESDVNYE